MEDTEGVEREKGEGGGTDGREEEEVKFVWKGEKKEKRK